MQPLYHLTKKNVEFIWDQDCQNSFQILKDAMKKDVFLHSFDWSKDVVLETDSSGATYAGIISQPDADGSLRPVTMFSHTFKAHEVNWSAHDKELYAIVHAFDHYRHFLEGVKNLIKVYSDHRALSHFMTTTDLSRKDRHRRWAEILMPHRFVIEYRPGKTNEVADGLSRYNFDDVHYENFPLLPPSRFSEKALTYMLQ